LSDVVERPKYQSTTRGEVSPNELEILQLNEEENYPPEPRPPEPARVGSGQIDFFVQCPTCGSRVGARHDQVGQRVRCSDCYSDVIVTAPKVKKTAVIRSLEETDDLPQVDIPHIADHDPVAPPVAIRVSSVVGTPTTQLPVPADQPEAIQQVHAQRSQEALSKAQKEVERSEGTVKLEKLAPFQQLFIVLKDAAVLTRILYVAGALFVVLTLLAVGRSISGTPQAPFILVLMIFVLVISIPLIGFTFKSFISIVQGTAVGQIQIQEWFDDFYASLLAAFQVLVAFSIASMPGGILASILYSAGVPPTWYALFLLLSVFLFLPFVLLSQLEGEHPFYVISLPVLRSMQGAAAAWMRCYAESFILFLITSAALYLEFWDNIFLRILTSIGIVICLFIFARSIGILGYACNRALMREEIRKEEQAMAAEQAAR